MKLFLFIPASGVKKKKFYIAKTLFLRFSNFLMKRAQRFFFVKKGNHNRNFFKTYSLNNYRLLHRGLVWCLSGRFSVLIIVASIIWASIRLFLLSLLLRLILSVLWLCFLLFVQIVFHRLSCG